MPNAAVEFEAGGRAVRISSPDKAYFPELGLTKLDVANYFLAVGPGILAALLDRPTTMERWPEGVQAHSVLLSDSEPKGDAFFQKKTPPHLPDWIQTGVVTYPSGRTNEQICPGDLATVLWMANLGTLRFHPWPVRLPELDLVDELRLDLDPQPGSTFGDAVRAALELREVMGEAGLKGHVKTSGGRGLHVFARIEPVDFIAARHAAIALGRELARRQPKSVTVNWWKEERGPRIFVDFNQMARDRLIASAYSIRPTPKATVSAPLAWEELNENLDPGQFTVLTMPDRFAQLGDLWAGLHSDEPASLKMAQLWYERDAAAGEGELPYPPEYPKMPGEPLRVQPSRKASRDGD